MANQSVFDRLIKVYKDYYGDSVQIPTSESKLYELPDILDSLDEVELLMQIEDEFQVELYDNKVEDMTTVGELVSYIESLLK